MSEHINSFNQQVGKPVIDWSTVDPPSGKPMEGSYCRVEALNVERHLNDLFDAFSDDAEGRLWTYMFVGPFDSIGWLMPYKYGANIAAAPSRSRVNVPRSLR